MARPVPTLVALALLAVPVASAAPAVTGLAVPESFVVDPATGCYYISNVNGAPAAKDDNGFLTKLEPDGTVAALKFVASAPDAPLHAPKGLAVVGKTLYVTDIDRVKGYDTATGRRVVDIDFAPLRPKFLNDLAADGKGTVYVSDSSAGFVAKFDAADPKPALVARGDALGKPNGLCVHPKTGALIVVTWDTGKVLTLAPDGAVKPLLAGTFKNLDGVDVDAKGALYFSSFTGGKVYRAGADGKAGVILEEPETPADIGIDRAKGLLLVPVFKGGKARIVPLP
jgi:sugar lactone lactonase YvrE